MWWPLPASGACPASECAAGVCGSDCSHACGSVRMHAHGQPWSAPGHTPPPPPEMHAAGDSHADAAHACPVRMHCDGGALHSCRAKHACGHGDGCGASASEACKKPRHEACTNSAHADSAQPATATPSGGSSGSLLFSEGRNEEGGHAWGDGASPRGRHAEVQDPFREWPGTCGQVTCACCWGEMDLSAAQRHHILQGLVGKRPSMDGVLQAVKVRCSPGVPVWCGIAVARRE